jgi:hypothetical protein
MNIVKYPLPIVAAISTPMGGRGGGAAEVDVKNEKMWLEMELDRKRMECTDVSHKQYQRQACDKALKELRNQMELLKVDPAGYVAYKQQLAARELAQASRPKSVNPSNTTGSNTTSNNQAVSGPIVQLSNGNAINTGTGEVLQKNTSGGFIGTQNGTYYAPSGGGLVNTQTGGFIPAVR